MISVSILSQAPEAWHREGLYLGMHWVWWVFWIAMLLILAWAFWRLYADRAEARREARDARRAEEALRERFARGEIDEAEFARRLSVLQRSRLGS